ncbi:MAG: FhaA domain-containing protein, partial [Solirubrobacteraceae bacterium]
PPSGAAPPSHAMSFLRRLESRIADLVEGSFSRVFKSEVRPVEIARKLAREMDDHKSYSLQRTYAPNEYRVFLSPEDRERFGDTEHALAAEFSGYLLEYARRERLALMSRPIIHFETDDRLRLGEFGIQTSLVENPGREPEPPPARPAEPGVAPEPEVARSANQGGRTMVHSTADRVAERLGDARGVRRRRAILKLGGKRLVVGDDGATLGRSRSSDVMVDDPNVSRAHAEVRAHGSSWVLTDLGSTNGTRLNGRRVTQPEVLGPGDEIEVGTTTLTFDLE